MANVQRMWQFFDTIDDLIKRESKGDDHVRKMLETFLFRILTVLDGLEGPDGWKGLALVAHEDLPEGTEEINDGFLHDMWSERKNTP